VASSVWRIDFDAALIYHRVAAHYPSHERIDGRGYPDGLAGESIPIGSRIIAVCDAFEAMTSDRPYRWGIGTDEALAELRHHAGTQFDATIVETFCNNPILRAEPSAIGPDGNSAANPKWRPVARPERQEIARADPGWREVGTG
jgi:HD-GYP domain-containing protein (c-di-GMP phosphodiesterase class II)